MNKKILLAVILVIFVPTIIAGWWLFSVSGSKFTPSNVASVVLKSPDKTVWEYTNEEEKEFFTTLASNLVSIEKQEFSEEEWALYELSFERTFDSPVFYLCMSPNAKKCLAYDAEGNWYRINTEDARRFLIRDELEGIYTNSTYPELSVLVSGEKHSIPARHYEWNYLLADEQFTTITDTTEEVFSSNVTISQSLGLKFSLPVEADWCDVKIFDGEALVFSGDKESLSSFKYDKDSVLRALVTCEWYQDEAKLYYGKTISEFNFSYDVKASAELNKTEFAPGEVISVKLLNSDNDTFKVLTDLKTSASLTQRKLEDASYVMIPLSSENKTGEYTIKLVSDNATLSLVVYVGERAIDEAAFSLGGVSAETYDSALQKFLSELNLDSYESSISEPLWKDEMITPVRKFDGEKERYWISAPVFAAKQVVNGTPVSTLNFGAHYVKSVDLDSLTARAIADGAVAFSGETEAFGNTLAIDHGFGLFAVYGHLGEITLAKGDRVTTGMSLADSSDTGITIKDGELFFGLIQDGVFVNPYFFVTEQRTSADTETFTPPKLF